jgi:phosphoadenosine phosphosulfate reductase
MLIQSQITELNTRLQNSDPKDILRELFCLIPKTVLSFSGAEDVVLVDMATKIRPDLKIFTLDTGRLHSETYRFIEKVRAYYKINIDMLKPDSEQLRDFVKQKGRYSFYEDGHEECCTIRKVAPLQDKLCHHDAWITGQRRDQNPNRAEVAIIELDQVFSNNGHQVIKINPLANWNSEQVWSYIRMSDIPYNELHDQGYASIGCEPCTRAIKPNEHERAGRWWWEETTIKECGLHIRNEDEEQNRNSEEINPRTD